MHGIETLGYFADLVLALIPEVLDSASPAVASLAATVLMCLLAPVGNLIQVRQHPFHTLGHWTACVSLLGVMLAPVIPGMPPTPWPCALLLTVLATAAVGLRKRFWQACKAELGEPARAAPRRRSTDFSEWTGA